jgi:methionyl-tRNA formyltransferase
MVDERSLRLVYFGTPGFAVPTLRTLIDSVHPVLALVSQPDRPKGRGHHVAATPTKEVAAAAGIPVLQPTKLRDEAFLARIAELQPDLGIVAAYGRILPDALLSLPRLGMINVHASLLPRYRGAAPVHRAVIAGDDRTGITIMRVVTELDAGPMLAAASRPVGPDETSVEVERHLADMGAALLLEVVNRMASESIGDTPQDNSLATYAPKLLKTESPIDWTLPARAIHNRVRGLQPWPMASTIIEGARCLIHRTAITGRRTDARPGSIVETGGDALAVAAGDGVILDVLTIQPEGRRAMSAREFASGRKLPAGALLGQG